MTNVETQLSPVSSQDVTSINQTPAPTSSPDFVQNQAQPELSKKTFLVKVLVLILCLTGVAAVLIFLYIRPQWTLAQAITNNLNADSLSITTHIPLKDKMSMDITSDVFRDGQQFTKTELSLSLTADGDEQVTYKTHLIANETDQYLKPYHSRMLQMYNLLLTRMPGLKSAPAFTKFEPVLNGTSWLHTKEDRVDANRKDQKISPFLVLATLITGFNMDGQERISVEAKDYMQYKLGLKREAVVGLLDSLKDSTLDLTLAEVNRISEVVQNSNHLQGDILTILVDTQTKSIHTIELNLNKELIIELGSQQVEQPKLLNPLVHLSANPMGLVDVLEQNVDSKITIVLSNLNAVEPAIKPVDIVEKTTLEDKDGVVQFVLQFLADPEMVKQATGQDNAYITATHETKLLFNQGKYQEGLVKANEAMALAKTDDDRAIGNYWVGLHLYKLGQLKDAENTLLQAASLKEKYAAPYVTLGSISLDQQNYEQMLNYSLKCAEYDPNYAWCYNNLGIAYGLLGEKQKGIEQLQKAVSLDPTSFVFNDNLKRMKAS